MTTDDFERSSVLGKGVRPIAKIKKNEELRKSIYFEIRKLNKTIDTRYRNSQHARAIEKFIDSMIPSKAGDDPGKLPVYAKRPVSPSPNKVMCVFYLVSCLIQSYWKYLKDESEINLATVETGLGILRDINRHYNIMHVVGDVRKGYVLEL